MEEGVMGFTRRSAGVLAIGVLAGRAHAADEALWRAVRAGRAVAIMRHALAPGTGDPAGFRLDDCSTQRNLSAAGRQQAREIGARFRAHGIERARVFSSQWCRCRETAEGLGLGAVAALPGATTGSGEIVVARVDAGGAVTVLGGL